MKTQGCVSCCLEFRTGTSATLLLAANSSRRGEGVDLRSPTRAKKYSYFYCGYDRRSNYEETIDFLIESLYENLRVPLRHAQITFPPNIMKINYLPNLHIRKSTSFGKKSSRQNRQGKTSFCVRWRPNGSNNNPARYGDWRFNCL